MFSMQINYHSPMKCHSHICVCVWKREKGRQNSAAPSQEQVCSHGNHPGKQPVGKGCYTSSKALYIDRKNLQYYSYYSCSMSINGNTYTIENVSTEKYPAHHDAHSKLFRNLWCTMDPGRYPNDQNVTVPCHIQTKLYAIWSIGYSNWKMLLTTKPVVQEGLRKIYKNVSP